MRGTPSDAHKLGDNSYLRPLSRPLCEAHGRKRPATTRFPGRPMGKTGLPTRRGRRSAPDLTARAPSRANPLLPSLCQDVPGPPIMRFSVRLLVVLTQPPLFQYRQKDWASPHARPWSSNGVMRWSTPTLPLPTRNPNRGSTRVTQVSHVGGEPPDGNSPEPVEGAPEG